MCWTKFCSLLFLSIKIAVWRKMSSREEGKQSSYFLPRKIWKWAANQSSASPPPPPWWMGGGKMISGRPYKCVQKICKMNVKSRNENGSAALLFIVLSPRLVSDERASERTSDERAVQWSRMKLHSLSPQLRRPIDFLYFPWSHFSCRFN